MEEFAVRLVSGVILQLAVSLSELVANNAHGTLICQLKTPCVVTKIKNYFGAKN